MKTIHYVTAILVLINTEGFPQTETSICSCFECVAEEFCTLTRNERPLTKLFLNIFLDHGYVSKLEADDYHADVTNHGSGSCLANKAALLTAYWLDKPQPSFLKGCNGNIQCDENMCLGKLKDVENWKLFNVSCDSNPDMLIEQKSSFHGLLQTIKKMFINNVKNQEFDEFIQHAKDVIPKDCPSPQTFKITDIIKVFFKIIKQLSHQCSQVEKENFAYDLPPCDLYSTYSKDTAGSSNDKSKDVYSSPDNTHSTWFSKPAPALATATVEKLQTLQHLSFLISSYQQNGNKTCLDKADMEHKIRCSAFADPLFLAKIRLINSLQNSVVSCSNCTTKIGYKMNKSCEMESLGKYISSFKIKQTWLQKMFRNLLKCLPYDIHCIERRKRDMVPEMFRFIIVMMKSSICENHKDQECQSNSTEELKIPSLIKYLGLSELVNGITIDPLNSPWKDLPSSNVTALLSYITSNSMLDYSKLILDNIYIVMSLPESTDENLKRSMLGGMAVKQESECQSVEELISPGCELYAVKLQGKLFLHMVSLISNCQQENLHEMFGTCKVSLDAKLNEECIYDNHKNLKEDGAIKLRKISQIATLIFGNWADTKKTYDNFELAIRKCAYYAVVLGVNDQIFGNTHELQLISQMKSTDSQLFAMSEIGMDLVKKLYQIYKCSDRCPRGYSYCNLKQSCVLKMVPCEEGRPLWKPIILPRMYANNITSTPWLVSSIAAGNISVVNREVGLNHDGGWEFNIDGHWEPLNSVPLGSGVKLNQEAKIRYVQKTYHYGFRILYYFDDHSDSDIGKPIVPGYYNMVKSSFMLIHPVPVKSDVTVFTYNQTYELVEDEYDRKGIVLSDLIRVHSTIYPEQHLLPQEFAGMIPSVEMNLFKENLRRFERSRPVAMVTNQYRHAGTLVLALRSGREIGIGTYIQLEFEQARLIFRPIMNFHGNLTLNFKICDCLAEGGLSQSKTTSITIVVHPVNDVPLFRSRSQFLPPLAFNLTDEPNNGFTIHELVQYTKTTDPEQGQDIGIAVYTLSKFTKFGQWQQLLGGEWRDIHLFNSFNPLKMDYRSVSNQSINALLLKSDDRIRFKLNNADTLWSYSTARRAFFIGFSYWDGTDGSDKGNATVSWSYLMETMAFTEPILGILLRRDCNNKLGSVARYDVCGICGGNGKKCIGCDGQKQSGAVIDRCGECTGGTTGLSYNFKLDCAGTCDRYEKDTCGICQRKGTKSIRRDFKDCNGVCFGRAKLDKCGVCSGGNTGVTPDKDIDRCKVCFGDDSTCKGCDGVLNSGKKFDSCGLCLDPSNPSFDSSCVRLKAIHPIVASSNGGEEIVVTGSGFNSKDIVCSFNAARGYTAMYKAGSATTSSFKIVTPGMTADKYTFKCLINNKIYDLEHVTFHVYDALTFKLTEIIPNQVPINQAVNITVIGQGFVDSGSVYCLGMMGREFYQIKGSYIDSGTVICSIPATDQSMVVSTALSFSEKRWAAKDFPSLSKTTFTIYAPPPLIKSAKLSDDFRKITVLFDQPAWPSRKKCTDIFSSATKVALGKRFRCAFKRNKELVISLGSRATVKIGDHIGVLKNSIKSRFQKVITHTPATDVDIKGPVTAIKPVAVLSGPTQIGICGNLRINGRKSRGAAGRPLIYKWNVEFGDEVDNGSLSSKATDGMTALKNVLAGLHSSKNSLKFSPNDFEFDVAYNFSLSVTNFLSIKSDQVNLAVTRVHDLLPVVKIRGGTKQRIKTRKLNKIQGYARIPKCAGANMEKGLVFEWEIDDSSITLDETSKNKPNLYIYPATLRGGQTYKLTLTVSFKSNPGYFTSSDVYLEVMSTSLVTKVKGGNRVVSSRNPFTLDASLSYDPDKENVQEWFEWECFTSDNSACFVRDANNTDQYVLYKIPHVPKITVQNGLLQSNQTYNFKVTYHKGERSKETTLKIKIQPGSPPVIKIRPKRKEKENIEDKIFVTGRAVAQSSPTRIWFECAKEDYAFVNLTEAGVLLTPHEVVKRRPGVYPFGMVFGENVLDGGLVYKFIVYAENKDGKGASDIFIRTNAPPSLGIFESNILNGTALSTDFTLSAVEGWEDDPEDFPLTYSFGYYGDNGRKRYLGSPSSENEKITKLSTGYSENYELTLFVEVSDVHKAMTRAVTVVTVTPPLKIDSKALTDMKASIDEAVGSEDISSTLGAITTTLSTLNHKEKSDADSSMGGKEQTNLVDTVIKFKENMTKSVLSMADNVKDRETQDILLKSMGEMTTDGDKFDDQTKLEIASKISSIVKAQTTKGDSRKRRSTESSTSEDGKSPEEVEDIVQSYSNIIDPHAKDNNSMSIKKTFTDLTTDLLIAMCMNVAYEQSAAVAKTVLGNLQAVKNAFENVNTTLMALSCETNCSNPARVVLGQDIQSSYASWACGSESCSGGCIGSVQYTEDLFSTNSNLNLLTDVVSVKFIDPESYNVLTIGNLQDPVQLQLPLKNENDTKYNYKCQMWDNAFSRWTNASCTSIQETKIIQGIHHVTCRCDKLGVVSVAANGLRDSGLEFGNATVDRNVLRFATVTIKFVEDYQTVVSRVGELSLKNSIQSSIVSTLRIQTWRIRNVSCRNGSIIVTFEFLSQDENVVSDALSIFDKELETLQQMIKTKSLVVTLSDMSRLTLDSSFVKVDVNVVEDGEQRLEKTSWMPLYIASGVVGGLLILGCIVFVLIKYKVISNYVV